MENQIKNIQSQAEQEIKKAQTIEELRQAEIKFLGRKGELPLLLRGISKLPIEQKATAGQLGNQIRQKLQELVNQKKNDLKKEKTSKEEFFDITAPAKKIQQGHLHPISKTIREIEDIFGRLGFQSISGDEIDHDWYNFEALNFPPDHPAREMQDTFFIKNLDNHVLRTQTSNMQIHYMQNNKPPFRIISPGKTFRKDSDATHTPMFHQLECLLIDKEVSIANLKWVLQTALSELLGQKIDLRFRLSFFPFTEPSLEMDSSCVQCKGKDPNCRVCKGTGWLEIGGAGMVHPNVLENVKVDHTKWNGFAFGLGIDRILMIKHQIDDLRLFFANDLRFLEQF